MEYYLTIKRNNALIQVITCMNFKNTMLRGRNQLQKITYCMSLFTRSVQY